MARSKRWTIAPAHPAAGELAARLRVSPVLAQILLNRGLREPDECGAFLSPSLKGLRDPAELANLPQAAERIARAIRDKEKIVVYGDYDVDGITGTATLWHAIRLLGGDAHYYIPHRLEEGYGLNAEAVTQICDDEARLIISVDCGIGAVEEAKIACARGVDLIVTDHHECHRRGDDTLLPECFTIVHPRLPVSHYANPHLCGSGVAFKLAWGIGTAVAGSPRVSEEFRAFLLEATALAALGTVADVVPLVGENRTLVHFGLGGLRKSKLKGMAALIASTGLTGQHLDSYHAGFLLAPRLNACGRMGHARLAVHLLTEAGDEEALEIAAFLESQNRQRQALEKQILVQALEQIDKLGLGGEQHHAIVLGAEGWHPGVIGIVASRIVERFHRPAILVALNEGKGQGSGRSVPGFHLGHALTTCREYLEKCGGHEMAAGLRLDAGRFEAFREAFGELARRTLDKRLLAPELKLECRAELRQITLALASELKRLGPFGNGNRRPLICCDKVEVAAPPRRVGRTGEHLQFRVRQRDVSIKCIAFNAAGGEELVRPGSLLDLAAEPTVNEFHGRHSVELEIRDLRPAGGE